jgi:toxin ParE1/3/4
VRVRYTLAALADLESILEYLAVRSPQGAARVRARVKSFIDLLTTHPMINARTDDPTIRRLVVAPCPYPVFYEAADDEIIIHNVHHSARDPVNAMKLHYYAETNSLYIELSERPGAETREIAEGVNIDLDVNGAIVGLNIDGAPKKLDLTTIETLALPVKATRAR